MDAIYDLAPGERAAGAEHILLVMLPGARDVPGDFVVHGFIRALRERHLPVDVVAADAHLGYYLEQQMTDRLSEDVITPACAGRSSDGGYKRIWLLGISLGGMGSLLYAREHATEIEGIVLLAPFLGNRGLIAEIGRAGGLASWQPGKIAPGDDDRALLAWLKQYRPGAGVPKLLLGYGIGDRFAPASMLLAERLPDRQVVAIPGGHDWPTWTALWQRLLDDGLLSGEQAPSATVR